MAALVSSMRFSTQSFAAVPSIVNLILRRTDVGEEELRRVLRAAPYTPSLLLEVIRSLPCIKTALWFFHWCRSHDRYIHGPSAYQVIFEIAARDRGRSTADTLSDLLDKSIAEGSALTLDSATVLVRTFGSHGMMGDVLRVLQILKPSLRRTILCNNILDILFAAGDSGSSREAINVAKDMIGNKVYPKCGPDSTTASIVYANLVTRKREISEENVADAIELANQGLFPANCAQFSLIINKLCQIGRASAAWDFLHAIKQAGGALAPPPCNSLLSGLARERNFHRMDLLFLEMEELGIHRNAITFGILINNLCKSQRIDRAMQLFDEMLKDNTVAPDVVIFNTLINGLCKAGRLKESYDLMIRMKKEFSCSPNTVTYNTLIDGFCKNGEVDKALELMERMKSDDVRPSIITLNTLIDGICRQGRISTAMELFRNFQSEEKAEVVVNAVTYSILVGAFLHSGNINKAEELYEEMLRRGLKPDAKTYFTMISGLAQAGKPEQANSVAAAMAEDGFNPDIKSYNILIAGFCRRNRLDRARDLLDEMPRKGIKPDGVTFNTLIASLSKAGEFTSAKMLIKKMRENGYKLSVITYGAMIHGYCRCGDVESAMDVLRAMDDDGVAANAVIFNIIIEFFAGRKDPESALASMKEMRERGIVPTTATYNSLFRCLKESNMLTEARALMGRMKEQGLRPDYVTVEILSAWLPAVGEATMLKSFIGVMDSSR